MTNQSRLIALAVTAILLSSPAFADVIAPLPTAGDADLQHRNQVSQALEDALHDLGHTLATPGDIQNGASAAGDSIDTSKGLTIVGTTAHAAWVVRATVGADGTQIEIRACQVATGRVEMLARDVDPQKSVVTQLKEMLPFLLRAEGVGSGPFPWENPGSKPVVDKKPAPEPANHDATDVHVNAPPMATPDREPLNFPSQGSSGLLLQGGLGIEDIFMRPSNAVGSTVLGAWQVSGAYSVMKSVEITGQIGGFFGSGNVLRAAVGARVLWPLTDWFALGGGATIGLAGQTSGAQSALFEFGLVPLVAFTLAKNVEIDAEIASFRFSFGSNTLGFVGASINAGYRFNF